MELTRGSAEYEGSIGGAPTPPPALPSSTDGSSTHGSAA